MPSDKAGKLAWLHQHVRGSTNETSLNGATALVTTSDDIPGKNGLQNAVHTNYYVLAGSHYYYLQALCAQSLGGDIERFGQSFRAL